MAVLKRPMVYALADSLGMELEYEEKTGRLRGKGERTVDVSGLRFRVPMEVVSWLHDRQRLHGDGQADRQPGAVLRR